MGTIIAQIKRPSREIIESIAGHSTSTLHECMGKTGQMSYRIKPIDSDMRVCGPAVTVDCPVGDNLTLHKAIEVARKDDVLVVNAKGYTEAGGMWGEIMTIAAQVRGIAGIVIDGGVRDTKAIREMRFPAFTSSISPGGTVKETLGNINTSIVCGGVVVNPGDIVVGDADGVVVVPANAAGDVAMKAKKREESEAAIRERLRAGETTMKIYGFDQLLAKKGVK